MGNGASPPTGLSGYGVPSQSHGIQDEAHWGALSSRSGVASSLTSAYYPSPGLMGPVPPRHQPYYGW